MERANWFFRAFTGESTEESLGCIMLADNQSEAQSNLGKSNLTRQTGLIGELRNKIRSVETASRVDGEVRVSGGCAAIDRLLPEGGYQRGTLVQWLTKGGQAADYLSLLAAKQAAVDGGAIVVFDPFNQFYPPAVAAIGINLDNLIILRSSVRNRSNNSSLSGGRPLSWIAKGSKASPSISRASSQSTRGEAGRPDAISTPTVQGNHSGVALSNSELDIDLLWSIDQALRCPAVAAVWGPIGRIDERWFRRFQLSAESSGCLGFFVQPIQQARQPSWADVQWLVGSTDSGGKRDVLKRGHLRGAALQQPTLEHVSEQLVRLQLTRCRGAQTGKKVNLSINTITGDVRVARRDHEQQLGFQQENVSSGIRAKHDSSEQQARCLQKSQWASSKNSLFVATQLANPANRCRGA